MIRLQQRDHDILDFLGTMNCATLTQIQRKFFREQNNRKLLAQVRMKKLYDAKLIKRDRSYITSEYIYYLEKEQQFQHRLLLTEFYINLSQIGQIESFEVQKQYDNVIPDGICTFSCRGYRHYLFIEVHVSNNKFDQSKYENYYKSEKWNKSFKVFPKIIIISDKKVTINPTCLKFIQIRTDCKDIEKILRIS